MDIPSANLQTSNWIVLETFPFHSLHSTTEHFSLSPTQLYGANLRSAPPPLPIVGYYGASYGRWHISDNYN